MLNSAHQFRAQQHPSFMMPPRPFKTEPKPPPENSPRRDNTGSGGGASAHHSLMHWRRTMDIAAVECLAAVIVDVAAIVYADVGYGDPGMFISPWTQLIPALPVGLVMLVCKSDQFMPPDASPTVTILMWLAGAFRSWIEVVARLMGHCAGFGIAILLCKDMALPPQWLTVQQRPGGVTFASEAVATTIEHVAVLCLLLPIFPPANHGGPPNPVVLHAAFVLAVSHWVLRVTFMTEMNPAVLVGKATIATWQLQKPGAPTNVTVAQVWDDCLMGVWGECVGLGISVVYASALCKQLQAQALLQQAVKPS